jgi:hypothetical protein
LPFPFRLVATEAFVVAELELAEDDPPDVVVDVDEDVDAAAEAAIPSFNNC